MSPASGYYTTSPKDAQARAARIAQRKKAAATPEGKRVIRERLSAKKATARARMTPQERHRADRAEQRAFDIKRIADTRPVTVKPEVQVKPTRPSIRHPFPGLTGPEGALGRKGRKK